MRNSGNEINLEESCPCAPEKHDSLSTQLQVWGPGLYQLGNKKYFTYCEKSSTSSFFSSVLSFDDSKLPLQCKQRLKAAYFQQWVFVSHRKRYRSGCKMLFKVCSPVCGNFEKLVGIFGGFILTTLSWSYTDWLSSSMPQNSFAKPMNNEKWMKVQAYAIV